MQIKGKITYWDDDKGFGFIAPPNAGGERVFIHIKAFSDQNMRPYTNQVVIYTLSTDKKGRPCAVNATLVGVGLLRKIKRRKISKSTISAILFLVIAGISVLIGRIPSLVFVLYLVASLITFIIYALDKSAAKKETQRTQESTLHLLSLAGGWPGALIAQQKLRHKSQKQSFRLIFWITVLLNCTALAWLFTPIGASLFANIL